MKIMMNSKISAIFLITVLLNGSSGCKTAELAKSLIKGGIQSGKAGFAELVNLSLPKPKEFAQTDLVNSEELKKTKFLNTHNISVWQIFYTDNLHPKSKKTYFSVGSAIAISPNTLLTSCDIIDNANNVFIVKDKKVRKIKLMNGEITTDSCILKIDEADLVPVKQSRPFNSLNIGEHVFSISSSTEPHNNINESKITGLKTIKGKKLIQTTTKISSDSSGGGLFDFQGNLIGITAVKTTKSDGVKISISDEEYVGLPEQYAKAISSKNTAIESDSTKTQTKYITDTQKWKIIDDAWNFYVRGEYKIAFNLWVSAGESGIPLGYHNAGVLVSMGVGIPFSIDNAKALFVKAAKNGIVDSQFNLANLIYYQDAGFTDSKIMELLKGNYSHTKILINKREVRELIFSAADLGHIQSAEILEDAYQYGRKGLPKIAEMAEKYKNKRIKGCAKKANIPYPKEGDIYLTHWLSINCSFPNPLKTPLRNCSIHELKKLCRH
jgi:S1-C subfamily serine protease